METYYEILTVVLATAGVAIAVAVAACVIWLVFDMIRND